MITPWFRLMRSLCCSETCWTRLASEEVENSQRAHLKFRACLVLKKEKNQNIEIYLDFRVKKDFRHASYLRCSFREALELKWFWHFKHRKFCWLFLLCSCFKCWTKSLLSEAWYWHWRQTNLLMLLKWPILIWSFKVRIWSDENLK